jgi:hypothetical protein
VSFSVLGAPIAVALVALLLHLGQALGDPRLSWYMARITVRSRCAVIAIAYAVERRQPPGEDYAFWVYLAGLVTLLVGVRRGLAYIGRWRHALPLVAAALVTASLYLRRRTLLVAVASQRSATSVSRLRRVSPVVALPIALAALGLLVIVATVWMQRRFPKLVDRVSREDAAGVKTLPAGRSRCSDRSPSRSRPWCSPGARPKSERSNGNGATHSTSAARGQMRTLRKRTAPAPTPAPVDTTRGSRDRSVGTLSSPGVPKPLPNADVEARAYPLLVPQEHRCFRQSSHLYWHSISRTRFAWAESRQHAGQEGPADTSGGQGQATRAKAHSGDARARGLGVQGPGRAGLLKQAREARMRQDSALLAYDATAYQRISAGLGFRAFGRDRLLFRTENVSRVRWSRENGAWVDLKGARTVIPW